jgi:hypothetical protein
MKLRIKGNSIRFRLLRSEVETLVEKGFLSEETQFSPTVSLYYGLIVSDEADEIEAKFEGDRIMIVLPRAAALEWAASEDIGISASQNGLDILVEKDLVCHGRPDDPDNADAF